MDIHSSAIVSPQAKLGSGVSIGPYSIIGPHVVIGADTRVGSHVVIDGHTTIGQRCEIHTGAVLGTPPQDKKYKGMTSYLEIGDDNIIREYVTMNTGSKEGSKTVVGHRNFIMINGHVGHDCRVGNDVTMANGSVLGGHALVEDQAVLGGYSGVHQFVRIGKLAMLGAFSKAASDVPPYALCDGYPARLYGLNSVGLRRAGYESKATMALKRAYKILFLSGLSHASALKQVESECQGQDAVSYLLSFVEKSKRGIVRASSRAEA